LVASCNGCWKGKQRALSEYRIRCYPKIHGNVWGSAVIPILPWNSLSTPFFPGRNSPWAGDTPIVTYWKECSDPGNIFCVPRSNKHLCEGITYLLMRSVSFQWRVILTKGIVDSKYKT
jgi:hypothetical protein